jgi:hypothetical protein
MARVVEGVRAVSDGVDRYQVQRWWWRQGGQAQGDDHLQLGQRGRASRPFLAIYLCQRASAGVCNGALSGYVRWKLLKTVGKCKKRVTSRSM